MMALLREALGYGVASACALVLDVALLWWLVHFLQWPYLGAASFSFLAGGLLAYELSIRLAFKHHRAPNRRVEAASFVAIGLVGLAINAMVMFIAVSCFGLDILIAKLIAASFTFACNFTIRRHFLFAPQSPMVLDR